MNFGIWRWSDNTKLATMTEFEAFFEEEVLSEVRSEEEKIYVK